MLTLRAIPVHRHCQSATAAAVVIGLHVTQYWTGTESPVCLGCKVLDRTDSLLARPCVL